MEPGFTCKSGLAQGEGDLIGISGALEREGDAKEGGLCKVDSEGEWDQCCRGYYSTTRKTRKKKSTEPVRLVGMQSCAS